MRFVVASHRVPAKKFVFIVEIMTVEKSQTCISERREIGTFRAYLNSVALINSAKFTPPTDDGNKSRGTKRSSRDVHTLLLPRVEFSPWVKAWRQSFTKLIGSTISRSAAIIRLAARRRFAWTCPLGERPRLCEAFSMKMLERARGREDKKERERGEREREKYFY